MSGFLALTGPCDPVRLPAALQCIAHLGDEEPLSWAREGALLSVTRKTWELGDDFSGPVLLLESPDLVVAADASLYYRKELANRLSAAGVRVGGDTPSHFVEAAYRAWGPGLADHLSGDYAFVVWDKRRRLLLAVRDPIGQRPLFFTRTSTGVAVSSSCRALAELRGGAEDLNLANLGGQVAGLAWSNGSDTAYRQVDILLPGRRLLWQDGRLSIETFWHPPEAPDRRPSSTAEAAEELLSLLSSAVSQRLSSGVTTVWMSGGWDSTAVFAAGQHGLTPVDRARLRPVSISYPLGDPGREDDLINQVADRWGAEVHWLRSDDLRLLDGLEERARRSDEPPAHLYELWNRGLARGTRAAGARIALDGCGGDQLFQVSDVFLADLLRSGHWLEFVGSARSRRSRGWRHLARAGVLPLVPTPVIGAAERMLGRRIPRHYLERSLTTWVRPEFAAEQRLRERDLAQLRAASGSSLAHAESRLYLTLPIWGWGGSFMRGALLQEGVEVRSPLLDLKVVEFALGRPTSERADRVETKILLRRAMNGLLPAGVLAPRLRRTGTTVGFSRQRMKEAYPALVARLFTQPLRLVELGIVDPVALRSAADRYFAGDGDDFLRVNLFHTMKTEFWLRGLGHRAALGRSFSGGYPAAVEIPAA